jgi:hypothetical protein
MIESKAFNIHSARSLFRGITGPLLLISLGVVLHPGLARACAVCFGGQEGDTRTAFIFMTAFMTFVPLLLVGAVIYWLWRQFRTLEDEERSAGNQDAAELETTRL